MANDPIIFPDIEDLLVEFLGGELSRFGAPTSVSVDVPISRPDEFVIVPRVGGIRQTIVTDAALIGFEIWAQRDARALRLGQLVRGLIHTLPGQMVSGNAFYRVNEVGGLMLFPDPDSQQARYVFTAEIHVRGHQLSPPIQ